MGRRLGTPDAALTATASAPLRVLVVDDDPDILLLCRLTLQARGYDVIEVARGQQAMPLVLRDCPDVVVLDIGLPDLDGLSVLERLRAAPAPAGSLPVVVLSARVGVQDQQRALEAGAVAYVTKPFVPDRLADLVATVARESPAQRAAMRLRALHSLGYREPGPSPLPREPAGPAEAGIGEVLDLAVDAIVSVDERQRVIAFNKGAETTFGYLSEEVLGKPLDLLLPERFVVRHQDHVRGFAAAAEKARLMGERREIFGRHKDGTEFPAEASITKTVVQGQPALTAILRDVTQRRRAEQELRMRARQQAAVADLGQRALAGSDVDSLTDEVVRVLTEVLSVELADVLELRPDRTALVLRAGIGWRDGLVGRATIDARSETQGGFTLVANEPTVIGDLSVESRFQVSPLLLEHGVVSSMTVTMAGAARPFGLLGVHSVHPRRFTTDDVNFLQSVANVLATAIQRERTEDRLRAFLEAAPDATLVIDAHGRIVSVNAATQELFGYGRQELLGLPVDVLVPERVRSVHASHRARYAREPRTRPMGAGLSLQGRRKDGAEVPVDIMLSPVRADEGLLVVAAVRDATERRRVDAVRDAFLHAVSHELRTPLTSVVGFASLLQGEDLGARNQELATRLLANARKLERLLEDLLDLDRLARGVVTPRRRHTRVADVVHDVVQSLPFTDHPLEVDISPPDLTATVDPAQLERIIENLLANVARHTPAGTNVWVRLRSGRNGLSVTVEDDGPGVPDELKRVVFEAFTRGAQRPHTPGTGIGLSLVAHFSELHGGRAWVEDRPGGGASFRVVLGEGGAPAKSAQPAADPARSGA